MTSSIYLDLTRAFNQGHVRAILSSGQAVVWHRLAIMSKDGDWIIRESADDLAHILGVLAGHGAVYRCGAPLDARWLRHGWSCHLEFAASGLRVRTDFVSRPPRIGPRDLERIWGQVEQSDPAVVSIPDLIEIKKTNREKDYAVIGELARRLDDAGAALRQSRSARDLIALAEAHADLVTAAQADRPALLALREGEDGLAAALDAERRALIRRNEQRLGRYLAAAQSFRQSWIALERSLAGLPLLEAHRRLVEAASRLLPEQVPEGWP